MRDQKQIYCLNETENGFNPHPLSEWETLGKPAKKNWIFYDNKLISIATYPPYLIMT